MLTVDERILTSQAGFPVHNGSSGGRWQKVAPGSPLCEEHTDNNGIKRLEQVSRYKLLTSRCFGSPVVSFDALDCMVSSRSPGAPIPLEMVSPEPKEVELPGVCSASTFKSKYSPMNARERVGTSECNKTYLFCASVPAAG
jgi:hypothetical protein